MKRLLLLFALECFALTLPSLNNPAIWNAEEPPEVEKMWLIVFRYSEPFEEFYNGKFDFVKSGEKFLVAAGVGSSVLDSIYRELEFSAFIAYKPFDFLELKLGETSNISWIPENSSWHEYKIFAGASLFYDDWAKLSVSTNAISFEADFNSLYVFGVEYPFRLFQKIELGYFSVYNSFAYPGPALGFGFMLNTSVFSAGASHLRAGYPNGHTGFLISNSR